MSNGIVISPVTPPNVVITAPEQRVRLTTPQQQVSLTIPTGQQGPQGPPGDDAQWDAMTQDEYEALPSKDPNTLYVIVP